MRAYIHVICFGRFIQAERSRQETSGHKRNKARDVVQSHHILVGDTKLSPRHFAEVDKVANIDISKSLDEGTTTTFSETEYGAVLILCP